MKRSILIGVLAAAVAALALPVFAVAAQLGVDPAAVMSLFDPATLVTGLAVGGAMMIGDIDLIRSKDLREKRGELVEENGKLLTRIEAETDQARVKELEAEWDKRDADIVKLTKSIERAERQEALEAEDNRPTRDRRSGRQAPRDNSRELSADEVTARAEQYRDALFTYLRVGESRMHPDDMAVLRGGYRTERGEVIDSERRDGLSTTNAAGGYTIPALFFAELQNSLLAYGGARTMARILTTDTGQSLPIPTVDDTANKAQIVSEGSSLTSPNDMAFGQVAIATFMYRSIIPITLEMLQDSAFNLEAWIKEQLVIRLGRGTNVHFTTGNGTTQPKGFIPGSSSGVTLASATSISTDDLVNLEHSVDPAYRTGASVGWQFNDGTLKTLKKLKDTQNRPLWLPGFAVKEPDTILGYKYVINQDMAAVQASNKSIAFGDWSKFMIRDVRNPLIVRANELYIANGQIAFFLFSRHGSNVLDAGTDPIKHGTHPSPD